MESTEPTGIIKISKREQIDLDIINKMHSIRDDQGSKVFGFSHGYLILKSRSWTVLGNFLLSFLGLGVIFVVLFSIKEPRPHHSLHFLGIQMSRYAVNYLFLFSGSMASNVAFSLYNLNVLKRWIWSVAYLIVALALPMVLFHWPFMGY